MLAKSLDFKWSWSPFEIRTHLDFRQEKTIIKRVPLWGSHFFNLPLFASRKIGKICRPISSAYFRRVPASIFNLCPTRDQNIDKFFTRY